MGPYRPSFVMTISLVALTVVAFLRTSCAANLPPLPTLPLLFKGGGEDDKPPTPVPKQPRILEALVVRKNGTSYIKQIKKSDLAHELDCPSRDLRLIDTSFPGNYAAFLARRSSIVLCVERLKAVIKSDEVLLFDPLDSRISSLVPVIRQQLNGLESKYRYPNIPFEQVVLEAILSSVCHSILHKLHQLGPNILEILQDLRLRPGGLNSFQRLLDDLLPLRNALGELHYTVQEVRKAMNDVLNSDEDMALMYLTSAAETGRGRRVDQHQEIEFMFENYLMQVEWADTEIKEIQHAIKNTEDTVEIQLDLLRNRILRFELVLSISSSVLGMGAFVTGAFGMNLLNGLEVHPKMFYTVTAVTMGTMLFVFLAAMFYGIQGKLL